MTEKTTPRHKKMYENSPRIETDDTGKKSITRGEKKSAEVNAGTEGVVKEGDDMNARHMKDVSDMHDRHMSEHKDMAKRHTKEMKKAEAESPEAGNGEDMIEKTETDKKE